MTIRWFIVVAVIAIVAGLIPLPQSSGQNEVDPLLIIEHLVTRSDAMSNTKVVYRHTRIVTDDASWHALRDDILFVQNPGEGDPRPGVNQWLASAPSTVRECWEAQAAMGEGLNGARLSKLERHRVQGCDTVMLALESEPGAPARRPLVNDESIQVLGNIEIALTDKNWVKQSIRQGQNYPLIPLDPSLAPWSDALGHPTVPIDLCAVNGIWAGLPINEA